MSKQGSVFPLSGNNAAWTIMCTSEYLDEVRMIQEIVDRLLEQLVNEAKQPGFREEEAGSIEAVAKSINWMFEKLSESGVDLRRQIQELRQGDLLPACAEAA